MIPEFTQTLEDNKLSLKRDNTTTCQVNLGLLCNQVCKHCHLVAGPHRKEMMNHDTMDEVIAFQKRLQFDVIDLTGGAPEMNPDLGHLIQNVSPITPKVILRSNLSVLHDQENTDLLDILCQNQVSIVSSLPSLNLSQTDSQRGDGVFEKSIKALQILNELGYGKPETGLVLDLVSNPSGAFMPTPQESAEMRFRKVLKNKWEIVFNNLYTFANVPLGRFETWLKKTGKYDQYLEKLYSGFNSCTIEGLMCRTLISVSWDGYLFDCDFNLAAGLHSSDQKTHISQIKDRSFENETIVVANHCYACTAGSGFT